MIDYKGKTYYETYKTGTHIATGQAAKEFSCIYMHNTLGECESRIWVLEDGTIESDD
jgi:hypothetical protein